MKFIYLFIFHLFQHKKLPDGHEERIVVRNDEGKKKKNCRYFMQFILFIILNKNCLYVVNALYINVCDFIIRLELKLASTVKLNFL